MSTPETPVEEREALGIAKAFHETYERLAPGYGYETRRESAVPWAEVSEKNRRLMEDVVDELLSENVIFGAALAAREYGKQREEKLERGMDGLGGRLNDAEADREKAEVMVRALLDEIECPSDLTQRLATVESARASLAENGGTGSGRCGRVMVGYGGEGSHLPTCRLPEGHKGGCSTENGDTVPDGLGDRRPGA